MTSRTCNKCGESKDLKTGFYKTGRKSDKNPNNRHYTCKVCTKLRIKNTSRNYRNEHLIRQYGIDEAEYNRILKAQCHKCAVCGTDKPGGKHKVFCVDHDHVTGKVRELLCKDCNIVLGIIKDSPEHLGRLIAYILKHRK